MYVKLFASLYQGTLRGCSDEILVFTNLLAHADQHGIVDKHWRAIAEETGLSREQVEKAIKTLESPDPESRSPEMNGCRIVRLDEHRAWGWKIVNYGKYRAIRNEDDRREQNRLAQERFRNKSKPRKPPSSQAEAEAEAEVEADTKAVKPLARSAQLSDKFQPNDEHFELANKVGVNLHDELVKFADYHRAKGSTMKDWNAAFRTWLRNAATFARKNIPLPGKAEKTKATLDYLTGRNKNVANILD